MGWNVSIAVSMRGTLEMNLRKRGGAWRARLAARGARSEAWRARLAAERAWSEAWGAQSVIAVPDGSTHNRNMQPPVLLNAPGVMLSLKSKQGNC